jgi:hypothetical protein
VRRYELDVIKDKGRETAFGQFGQRSVSGGQGVWKTKSPVAKSMALAMNTHNT